MILRSLSGGSLGFSQSPIKSQYLFYLMTEEELLKSYGVNLKDYEKSIQAAYENAWFNHEITDKELSDFYRGIY